MPEVITNNLDLWTSALLTKSTAGRGSNGKLEAYGIKKLRELILELAVRGKLVPQDVNDEPAGVLLERMAQEKLRLVKEGLIRKQKELTSISDDEVPFALPVNWGVERLGIVSHLITKGTTPTTLGHAYVDSGVSFVKVENIDRGRIQGYSISQFIDEETNQALERSRLAAGDVLFSIAGTIGKTCIVYEQDLPANTNQALAIIRGSTTVFDPRYLIIQLDSFVAETTRAKARGGAMPNVSLGDITDLVLPVPPMAEQHRIIAKVDELMALCDQLEQQQTDSIAAHQTLVGTLLGTLTRVESQQEFNSAWTRIASHFDTLFTTEASIDQLKQTILQLAVMGKLVPQDPNDEPASVLLKRIQAEKAKLIAEGKLKKDKPLARIEDEEKPFELPNSWKWVRLGEALNKITDGTHHSPTNTATGDFKYISAKNIKPWGLDQTDVTYVTAEVHQEIYSRCDPELGDVLYIKDGATTGIGTINSLSEPFSMLSSVALLKPSLGIKNTYLLKTMVAPLFYDEMRAGMTGVAITRVTLSKLNDAIIPLPPLAEQQRIVAKVDELMALCDSLKARLADAQSTQLHLADAIVEQAVC